MAVLDQKTLTSSLVCRIRLERPDTVFRRAEPFTTGVALPRGWCGDADALRLEDTDEVAIPLQTRVLERWSDGSVRWVLLDFQAAVGDGTTVRLSTRHIPPPPVANTTVVAHSPEGTTVTIGATVFRFAAGTASPLAAVSVAGRPRLDEARTHLVVEEAGGRELSLLFDRVVVDDSGPLRTAISAYGRVLADVPLGVTVRVEMCAGHSVARMQFVLRNPRAASHSGGYWELGDAGSVRLKRVALKLSHHEAPGPISVRCAVAIDTAAETFGVPFLLHQESSGKPNWQSSVHVNRDGVVPLRYSGYTLQAAGSEDKGPHATPIVEVDTGRGRLAVASRLFWETFPKAYAVGPDGSLTVDILPNTGDLHELQGGEELSHEFLLAFDTELAEVDCFRRPSTAVVDSAWWAATGDVPCLDPVTDADAPYERLVQAAIEGNDTFCHKRDRIDEYGWRHFGDLYADHENGASSALIPIVSHYNNQYDGIFGFIVQFMRHGDSRWWQLARDLAAHVAHIDIYWTDNDKSAYSGGLFWHTYHYVDAGRSSHRTYPRARGVAGGGPSSEHNYSTGLLLHYLMTGAPRSRDAVLRLACWTREMDDGARTVFRFLSRAPTGYPSGTGGAGYQGPGRGPGNAIHTMLNAARLEPNPKWLAFAETLIRRCIHPEDDLEALNLLDAERRWYYTVFLQALGRYLHFKSERGEEDDDWHYARASLLHYARWMATHEYPYLDKPEILEYPTETWAAQDMRKCEVFDLAATYTSEPVERDGFVERARFFFDVSVSTLNRWPTRTWTRPVVLMLSYGYAHLWHEAHREALPLLPVSPASDFGRPARFEPQRAIALRRAKLIVAAAALGAIAGAITLFL